MRLLGILLVAVPSLASAAAPDPGRVCVLQGPGPMARPDLSAVILRAVRTEVETLFPGRVQPTPPIDFEGLQLALGCMGESPACMTALAKQVQADTLVIVRVADLDRGYELILERVEVATGLRAASERRRVPIDAGGARLLDVVPSAVPVLFGRKPPPPPPIAIAPPPPGPNPYAIGTASAGAVVMVVGAIFGALSSSALDSYALAPVRPTSTRAEVDVAADHFETADGRATAANVMFLVGGALIAGGVAWLAVELSSEGDTPPSAQPEVVAPPPADGPAKTAWEVGL